VGMVVVSDVEGERWSDRLCSWIDNCPMRLDSVRGISTNHTACIKRPAKNYLPMTELLFSSFDDFSLQVTGPIRHDTAGVVCTLHVS